MQRRAALILVVITPALLITSCKSSNKSKLTTPPAKLSATAVAPATTAPAPAPAPAASASATPTAAPPPAPASSASPSPSTSPSAPASITGSATPTNLDPCVLVTQSEASTLANATFGPGKEEAEGSAGKGCIYGAQTKNVMDVIVVQATDAKTAQAAYTAELGRAESMISSNLPAGIHVSVDTSNSAGVGDLSTMATGSTTIAGQTISFAGIYVISGSTFFTIGDLVLNQTPPTPSAVQDQAKVVISRL